MCVLRKAPIVLLLMFVTACGSSSQGTSAPVDVRSYAFLESPVADAAVSITDVSGNVVEEKSAPATGYSGACSITLDYRSAEFRIVVSGGNFQDAQRKFNGRLVARVKNMDLENRILYINAVTTLVAAYLDRHPDQTLEAATYIIKAFLEIPRDVDIGEGLYLSDQYFSHQKFMVTAAENGGFDNFIRVLLAELDQNSAATHRFLRGGLGAGGPGMLGGCPGTSMAQAARNGLIAWGVGLAMNVAFDQMGLGDLFGGSDPQLGEIKEKLNEMKDMLRDIQGQISNLSGQIAEMKSEILTAITEAQYGQAIGNIVDYENLILNTFRGLKNELDLDPATLTERQRTSRLANITYYKNLIGTNIFPYRGALHSKLYGSSGANGALYLYAMKVKSTNRYWKGETQRKVQAMFQYYNMIEALEIELCVEYARASQMAKLTIDGVIDTGEQNSQQELDWFNSVTPIPYGHVWDSQSGLMVYTNMLHPYYGVRFVWPRPNCPIPDENSTAAEYAAWDVCFNRDIAETIWLALDYINQSSQWGESPFSDWRLATSAEWQAFFAGWSPGYSTPADYYYAKVGMDSSWIDPWWGSEWYENLWLWTGTTCGTNAAYVYQLNNGALVCRGSTAYYNAVPARKPSAGQKFFWTANY